MSAREEILRAVRAARPAAVPLPPLAPATAAFPRPAAGELAARFADAAQSAGARVVEGARAEVARIAAVAYPGARRVVSTVEGVPGTLRPRPGDDPRPLLADLDLFVAEATLGVAENGAVWLPASALGGQRAALFLATHVIVAIERARVVADLHQAYARLDVGGEPFGLFVAGPSKTADIEQSLVIGAHGPKGLTVVLLDGR